MISAISSVGDRRGVRRLEHDGVAGGERRRELPDRHHHRVVPRRHLGAHADRLAPDERGVAGHVLAGRRPSRTRAAPAKNRIWSTSGGISSRRRQRERLAGVARTRPRRAPRRAPRGRRRCAAAPGCARTAWRRASRRTPSAAPRRRASTSSAPDTGAVAKTSPVLGSMQRRCVRPSAASTYSPSDEVLQPARSGCHVRLLLAGDCTTRAESARERCERCQITPATDRRWIPL